MKRILIITTITIVCLGGLYIYLTWNNNGNPRFMHHRYNKVITEPLAKIGFADAQYKMGLFYIDGAINPPSEEYDAKADLEKAIYWLGKASAKGNEKAKTELARTHKLLDEFNDPLHIEFEGHDYKHGVMYYDRAVKYITEDNDAGALDCTMKALVILERLGLQDDSLYLNCVGLIHSIEEIAERESISE